MLNVSEDHCKARPYKEASLPSHSYIAPPVLTAGRQEAQGLSLWPTQTIFTAYIQLHQTHRFTFKITANFPSFPVLELHPLLAVWHNKEAKLVSKLPEAALPESGNIRCNQHSLRTEHSDYSFNLKTSCIEHQGCTARDSWHSNLMLLEHQQGSILSVSKITGWPFHSQKNS